MESIKINGGNTIYMIRDIQKLPDKTLRIVFDGTVPDEFGNIEVFTKSGNKYADIVGYESVVSIEDKTVILATVDHEIPKITATPTAESDLMQMIVDHEYRITLSELGVI